MCFAAWSNQTFEECGHYYAWITDLETCGHGQLCLDVFDEAKVIRRSGLCYACIHELDYDAMMDPSNPNAFVNTQNPDYLEFMKDVQAVTVPEEEEEEMDVDFDEFLTFDDDDETPSSSPSSSPSTKISTLPMSAKARGKQPEQPTHRLPLQSFVVPNSPMYDELRASSDRETIYQVLADAQT